MRRICPASLTVLFFSLQVLAISMEAIPKTARDPLSPMLRGFWQPLTHPYVRLTSQWQNWNLFAPDPLREGVTVHIDVKEENGLWKEIVVIGPGVWKWPANCGQEVVREGPPPLALARLRWTTSCGGWWRETGLLKVARALAQEHPKYGQSRQEFLQRLCTKFGIPGGGTVRLRARFSNLAKISTVSEVVRAESVCSSPS